MAGNRQDHEADAGSFVPPDEDRETSRRLRIILVGILAASLVVGPLALATHGQPEAFQTAFAATICSLFSLWLDRKGRLAAAVQFLVVSMVVAVTAAMIVGEGIHDAGMIQYPMIIVTGALLLRPGNYFALVGAVVASVTLVFFLGWKGLIADRFRDITDPADLAAILTVLVILAIGLRILTADLFRSVREARRESAERKAAEAEVRRLNEDLERRVEERTAELAAANEELEAFAWSVSHDLRAPLRVVGGYVGMLDQDYAEAWEPGARRILERIRASNARMNLLIDELLAFSRLGRLKLAPELVDVDATVRRVVDELSAGAPQREVEWKIGPLPAAWADPVLLEQVLHNLLGNAWKYSARAERACIEVGARTEGAQDWYYVRDNGVGFDPSQAHRLFGVFERLHREDEFEGTGIGLATVQRILKKHGGGIEATSRPGEGAEFRFVLPPRPVARLSAA